MTENPEATLTEIEKKLGLTLPEVKVFLRHGRFVAFENLSKQVMKCIRCGAPPEHADLCQGCFEHLVTELVDELDPEAKAHQEA
jgi:hypothetical protein